MTDNVPAFHPEDSYRLRLGYEVLTGPYPFEPGVPRDTSFVGRHVVLPDQKTYKVLAMERHLIMSPFRENEPIGLILELVQPGA